MRDRRSMNGHGLRRAAAVALAAATVAAGVGAVPSMAQDGPVTIVVETSVTPWLTAYKETIKAYEAATGNTVDLREFPNQELWAQTTAAITGGQQVYDVVQVNEANMVDFMTNEWGQLLTDIDPAFTLDPEIFTYRDLTSWDPETKTFRPGGETRVIPLQGNLQIFYYRTDIYEQLGLSVPTTWDEIVANGQAAQASGIIKYGGAYRLQGTTGIPSLTFDFLSILNGVGGAFFKDEGTDYTITADTPEFLKALQVLRALALTGPEATTTMGQAQAIAELQAGDAAQSYLVTAAAGQLENPNDSAVAGLIGHAPLPLGPTGLRTISGTWELAVPVGLSPERSKAALEYIQFVTSQEGQTVFAANGGVPVRGDLDTSTFSEPIKASLEATAISAPAASGLFRFSFAVDFMTVTEPLLTQVASGEITPEEGAAQLQAQLTDVVVRAGTPLGD